MHSIALPTVRDPDQTSRAPLTVRSLREHTPAKCVDFAHTDRGSFILYKVFTYATSNTDDKRFSEEDNRMIRLPNEVPRCHLVPEHHRLRSPDYNHLGSSER